ncbi:ATP-binding cassette domain-containing protein [Salinicoccus sp. HZC-1]|uniref:ATP-binding cassette domain-containing protein n=1 Tax=Salinicoccus sp. HZC-1 TaxID=3385497 RepID=UPI00398A5735
MIEKLKMDYGKFQLHAEGLKFGKGLHVVLGPNGSGKSSMMKGIIGYGDDSIKVRDIYYQGEHAGPAGRIFSYLPQSNPVFRIDVEAYIKLTTDCEDSKLYNDLIEMFELKSLAGQTIEELSGGEFKRVQCAQIAMEQKKIIMLDEVEQGLDLKYQHQILKWMKSEAGKKAVIANMHDAALAMTYADTVTMIKDGKVIEAGVSPHAITSAMLSECYSIPLTIERRQNSIAVFHTPL